MRGFLNEIKNVAINRATNRLNNVISDALGGGRTTNPGGRGGVDRSNYASEITLLSLFVARLIATFLISFRNPRIFINILSYILFR
jgi:hypothetical protein